jgi:hypothetical protein
MMVRLATLPRNTGSKSSSKSCDDTGCKKTTREGKPFCPDHVDLHDYVQNIQAIILAQETERTEVEKKGAKAVDVNGNTAKEILLVLMMNGSRTLRRISREINLDNVLVQAYVDALEKAGKVRTGVTTRGDTTVAILK